MDRKEDNVSDMSSGNKCDENYRGKSPSAKPREENQTIPNQTGRSSLPLHEINCKNVHEYLASIENAQKKWLENARSWPVKDEIQNAQIKWLKELSLSGTKFLTSTPQPKKSVPYTLPWSPPRSSSDDNPRRGVCIYNPGYKPPKIREYVNERGYTVKVARVEEPETVQPVRKPQKESQCKSPREQPNQSGFIGIDDKNAQRTPKKRYITVRKRLERLKPPEAPSEEIRPKSSTSPDIKQDEKREAAREYILRKRAQRERELEEEKKQEAKALEEKKARMQRLKETQQRLIKNALKRQTQENTQCNEDIRERDVASRDIPENEDSYLWSSKVSTSTQPKRKSLTKATESPKKDQNSSEMKISVDSVIDLETPIVELLLSKEIDLEGPVGDLLLNKDLHSKQVLEFLEEACMPSRPISPGNGSDATSYSECHSPPKRPTSSTSKLSSGKTSSDFPCKPSCPMAAKPSPPSAKYSSIVSPKPSTSFTRDSPQLDQIGSAELKPPDNSFMELQAPMLDLILNENLNLEVPFKSKLLLNNDLPTKQAHEYFEEARKSSMLNSLGNGSEAIHDYGYLSSSKKPTSPTPRSMNAKTSGTSPKLPSTKASKDLSLSTKPSFASLPKPSSIVSPKPSTSFTRDCGKKEEYYVSRSCSENSLSSSSKENQKGPEESLSYYNNHHYISPTLEDIMGRPFSLRMAVQNKHAIIKQMLKDSSKGTKNSDKCSSELLKKHINERKGVERAMKDISEKGVQCSADANIYRPPHQSSSKNRHGSSSLDSSEIRITQNVTVKKADTASTLNRTSDPYLYGAEQSFCPQEIKLQQDSGENFEHLYLGKVALDKNRKATINDPSPVNEMVVNGKGRPNTEMANRNLPVDPLNVPKELNLLSNIQDINIDDENKFTKSENEYKTNTSLLETAPVNFLNVPPSVALNSAFLDTAVIDDSCQESAKPMVPVEVNESSRDSRIESEIRKLDFFNESIASVIEKNKTVLSHNETNLKSSCEESTNLEKTRTSTNTNNDTLLEMSRNTILRGSQSSSSLDLPSEDISGTSIAKFSLNMFNELLKDEDLRSTHQASLFKMKESTITEKAKAEIAFLELEKKKLKQAGNEECIRNIRKKIRGLIIRLEHDLEELHKVRKFEKIAYRKRRQRLVDKINLIKMQLKAQSDAQNKVGKNVPTMTTSGIELKKTHINDRRGSDIQAFLERKKKELEHRELALNERLKELENISSWKQRLEDGEKKIQELEACLKMPPTKGMFLEKNQKENESLGLVERGTSPFRLTSDESQGERQKAEASYSDTFDQASSSSTHDRLEGKDARKMMAIKTPLSPRVTLKRRHSSGSDESVLFSQTETQSEASDMEVRVLALQQQLKQRKAKLESLHREYKKSQRERLIAKEQSLLSQIQAYDLYIDQVRKDIEKGKEESNVKIVKPLIKQPKPVSERRKSDTWLIQEKDKHESVKHSLQSSFHINNSAGVLATPTKTIRKCPDKKESDFNLDTKSLEKLSLKSKLLLKNSFSETNLLENLGERVGTSKISLSSTESCESDAEKAKLVSGDSDSKGSSRQHSLSSGKRKLHIVSKGSLSDRSASLPDSVTIQNDSIKDGNAKICNDRVGLDEPKSDINSFSQKEDLNHDNSEENSHIVGDSEINEQTIDISKIEEIGSEEIDGSFNATSQSSPPVTELDLSPNKSENIVEIKSKYFVNNTTSPLHQKEAQSNRRTLPGVICREDNGSLSENCVEEIFKTHTTSNGSIGASNRLKSSKDTLSESSIIDEIKDNSLNLANQISEVGVNENVEILNQLSLNDDAGNSKVLNEETVREVTYLEVSDHALTESMYNKPSEMSMREVSEESNISNENLYSNVSGGKELEADNTNSIKEQLSNESSPHYILEEKSTIHSLSEVEEHLSKSASGDLSDHSFPLPVTKELNSSVPVKSIEKMTSILVSKVDTGSKEFIISGQDLSNEESASEAASHVQENSRYESVISELVSIPQGNSSKESVISEVISLVEGNSIEKSLTSHAISLTQENTNKESILSEVLSLAEENTNKESILSEVLSLAQENTNKESILSEVLSLAQENTNKESILSEVLSLAQENTNKESVISEVLSLAQENTNKESILSEVLSLAQGNSNKESVISEVLSLAQGNSNKESVISEVLSLAQGYSNKESTISEVVESAHTEIPSDVKISKDEESKVSSKNEGVESGGSLEMSEETLQPDQIENEEPFDKSVTEAKSLEVTNSNQEEGSSEVIEEERSFSEVFDEEVKSPLDDSVVDHSSFLRSLKMNSSIFDNEEEYESGSDGSDSFIGERLTEEDVYNLKTPLKQPRQMWTEEADLKGPGAPLIEALQREGGSALDVVWRGIAEEAVEEASKLVISTYLKKSQQEDADYKDLLQNEVGDNDEEEWRQEKLSQEQAEAEAEILRLQQLRIDKEIEELEEEEARQYYYVRAIPDKPPPPYTPRRSSLVGSVVEAAGEIWSGQASITSSFMPGSHLREFLWDLAAELVLRVNPPSPPLMAPWVRSKRRRPKKPIRTKEQLLEEVEKEAKIYLGVEERKVRENLIIRWSRKRRDHVDEILVRESQEEEWEWTDFTEEENIIKNRIAEALIQDAISTATLAIAGAFEKKFNGSSCSDSL